jgi:hypothetical protein
MFFLHTESKTYTLVLKPCWIQGQQLKTLNLHSIQILNEAVPPFSVRFEFAGVAGWLTWRDAPA